MPTGVSDYRDCKINWELTELFQKCWQATATIVFPANPDGMFNLERLPPMPERFTSEYEALEAVLSKARQWIDGRIQ